MKFLFVLLLLLSSRTYAAPLCEVYGISDSPQALTCKFQRDKIDLACLDGSYFLDGELVEMAFHLEVEEGPTPLVFRTKSGDLTVTLNSGRHHEAVLSRHGKKLIGNCRF